MGSDAAETGAEAGAEAGAGDEEGKVWPISQQGLIPELAYFKQVPASAGSLGRGPIHHTPAVEHTDLVTVESCIQTCTAPV